MTMGVINLLEEINVYRKNADGFGLKRSSRRSGSLNYWLNTSLQNRAQPVLKFTLFIKPVSNIWVAA